MTILPANGPHPLMASRSAQTRTARMEIRRDLRAGRITLTDVLADPHDCLDSVALLTLASWRRGWGRDRLRLVGRRALRDQINLCVTVGDAGRRTLDWLVALDAEFARYPSRAA